MRTTYTLALLILAICSAVTLAAEDKAPTGEKTNDGWHSLFNGKDLSGWKKADENRDTIQVKDGHIVIKGERSHIFYDGPVKDANFKNFRWKCELMTKPQANSGMYFHTKYQPTGWPSKGIEVQVNNTHDDPRKTGSLYRAKDIMNNSPAKDNEWFTQEVIVRGKHVIVKVNGKKVNEYTEPEGVKRDAGWEDAVISSGTFALQGHDPGSEVHYRKVLVKPLPDDATAKQGKRARKNEGRS